MNKGANRLARVIQSAARGVAEGMIVSPVLGTLKEDMSLVLDDFPVPIPRQDYLVLDWTVTMRLPEFSLIGTSTAPVDEFGNDLPGSTTSPLTRYDFHAADVEDVGLDLKEMLKPGDRVLCVPVNQGRDYVIVGRVVSGA